MLSTAPALPLLLPLPAPRAVQVNKAAGAIGSRLTGAGWGGCTVSLVREADVAAFIDKVSRRQWLLPAAAADLSPLLRACLHAACPAQGQAPLHAACCACACACTSSGLPACQPVPPLPAAGPQVKEGYFKGLIAAGRVEEAALPEHIFASKPASGGAVLNLKL